MSDEFCRLPSGGSAAAPAIRRMLSGRRIAIVGLSDDPSRPSFDVARYLRSAGKEILPVNPNHRTVIGLPCYASLEEIPGKIDVVNVFRRPEFCAGVARAAVAIGAGGLWLQSGIVSEEAAAIARHAGLDFAQDKCMKVELMMQGGT